MTESVQKKAGWPKKRTVTLARVKKESPHDLEYCQGYVWHVDTLLGKGSFGKVYYGWSEDGSQEVAVKVVKTTHFQQNPKLEENLRREINILELLKGCEHVVHLHHVEWMKKQVVLVMELCEFDLDELLEEKQFKFREQDVIVFLRQFTQGMKALREQNIVHRDLKPGNILIKRHPTTGKMMIKLADFGYARHFKDENNKPVDLTSVAGTPVFMAPEALDCVYKRGRFKSYDDKVDIWSIGALFYKIIVGQCGFYAEQDLIGVILEKKRDAIAFTRQAPRTTEAKYIYKLPSSVDKRFSKPFKEKMNKLLQAMLKVEPSERMTFSEFEDAVEDISTSKVVVVNLLHGTSVKLINDSQLTVDSLVEEVTNCTRIPRQYQVLFSTKSQHFISPQSALSEEQFRTLLDESGGSQGHAKLYLLPVNLVESDSLQPDYSCLAGFMIDDEVMCVSKIKDHKFSDEMVRMINNMESQQVSQLEGVGEFWKFMYRESAKFANQGYKQLTEMGHQALAEAKLAIQWLQQDLSSLPDKNQGQLGAHLQTVNQHKAMAEKCVQQLNRFKCVTDIAFGIDIEEKVIIKTANSFTKAVQNLCKIERTEIHGACKTIHEKCQKFISDVTERVKGRLQPVWSRLFQVWKLDQTSSDLHKTCAELDRVLKRILSERASLLSLGLPELVNGERQAVSTGSSSEGPSLGSDTLSLSAVTVQVEGEQDDPAVSAMEALKKQNDELNYQIDRLTSKLKSLEMSAVTVQVEGGQDDSAVSTIEALKKENDELSYQIERLTSKLKSLEMSAPSYREEERTIIPDVETPTPSVPFLPCSPSDPEKTISAMPITEEGRRGLEKLSRTLEKCCTSTDKLKSGVTAQVSRSSSKPSVESTILFPSFTEATQASIRASEIIDIGSDALLSKALKMSEDLQASLEGLVETSINGTLTLSANNGLVKIARPADYQNGDLVLFHPVKAKNAQKRYSMMLHLERPIPYMLMDESCYRNFAIRPGKMPDLILGKLIEKPTELKFEDNDKLAQDLGCPTSKTFFRVKAEATELKFSAPHSIPTRTSGNLKTSHESDRRPSTDFLLNKQDKGGGFV